MHASVAFVNGAGTTRRRSSGARSEREELRLLNTLLSTATPESSRQDADKSNADKSKSIDTSTSKDERQAEEESRAEPISKPGGFENDPKDPTNPNEVRERHLKKIKR